MFNKQLSRILGLLILALVVGVGLVGVNAQFDARSDDPQDLQRFYVQYHPAPVHEAPALAPEWVAVRQQYEPNYLAPAQNYVLSAQVEPIRVEVAEDGSRFIFDDLNLFEDGMPGYGSAFVTQGYIYPVGTLNGSNGVLENGEPEFPDQVLGTWTCYGWMIGDGAHTETGEWVISTQVYHFNNGSTLITDGFEIVDFDMPVTRAITGGTGEYRSASGEMVQILRGFTDAMGVNLSVEFEFDAS